MNIRIKNYQIEQETNSPSKFNLRYFHTVLEGKTKGTIIDSVIAWGVSIPKAIELIAHYELFNNDEVVSMKEFVAEYQKISEEIKQLVQL